MKAPIISLPRYLCLHLLLSSAESQLHSLRLLYITLMDVGDILPHCELSDDRLRQYSEAHKECMTVLEEINGKLAKFLDMGSGGTKWSSKARDVWKRLQWDEKDIKQQQERLESIRNCFDSFLQFVN